MFAVLNDFRIIEFSGFIRSFRWTKNRNSVIIKEEAETIRSNNDMNPKSENKKITDSMTESSKIVQSKDINGSAAG